jgi:hypothetical protein
MQQHSYIRFEASTAATVNHTIFWEVRLFILVQVNLSVSEDSASFHRTTWPYIPENITYNICIFSCVLELLPASRFNLEVRTVCGNFEQD